VYFKFSRGLGNFQSCDSVDCGGVSELLGAREEPCECVRACVRVCVCVRVVGVV
jgi:hypothetical protein